MFNHDPATRILYEQEVIENMKNGKTIFSDCVADDSKDTKSKNSMFGCLWACFLPPKRQENSSQAPLASSKINLPLSNP